MFTLMIMLTLFLLITAVLGITASNRRVAGHYIQFAGLYDMALSANERALFLLRDQVEYQTIAERVHQRLYEEGIENHLIYQNEAFFLNDQFLRLFREEKHKLLADYLANAFGRIYARYYYYAYALSVGADTYEVHTFIENISGRYRVRSTASKLVDGNPGTMARVEGIIEWPALTQQIPVWPKVYTWREGPPAWFMTGAYPHADFSETISLANLPLHHWEPENALHITDVSALNISSFANTPTIVIYTGPGLLQIDGAPSFRGIIISPGDVVIEGMMLEGSVIAGGAVYFSPGAWIEPYQDMLFSIPMTEATRRMVFDILGLTSFGAAGGQINDVQLILGDVKIADFALDVGVMADFKPQLIGVQRRDITR